MFWIWWFCGTILCCFGWRDFIRLESFSNNDQHVGWLICWFLLTLFGSFQLHRQAEDYTSSFVPPKSNVAPGAWGEINDPKMPLMCCRHRKKRRLSDWLKLIRKGHINPPQKNHWIDFCRIKTQVAAKTLLCSASLPFRPKAAAHPGRVPQTVVYSFFVHFF